MSKKKSLVGWMSKDWKLLLSHHAIFLNGEGIARVKKGIWASIKVRITIEEL